jgi:hypothetical protein
MDTKGFLEILIFDYIENRGESFLLNDFELVLRRGDTWRNIASAR